jgi:hypothetical protein
MLSNPHAGTDLESPWEQGFAAGFLAADKDLSPPSPMTPEAQEAYSEAVQAGRFSINGMRVPATASPKEVGTWDSLIEFGVEHGLEHVLLELAKHNAKKVLGREVTGSSSLADAFLLVMSISIFGPDRSEPFFDEAAIRALERVTQQIAERGLADDNVELFLAACDLPDHNLGNADEFFRQGFWHGRVFLDFESAKSEAVAHDHPGDTIVFRFQTASPGLVEVIELDGT